MIINIIVSHSSFNSWRVNEAEKDKLTLTKEVHAAFAIESIILSPPISAFWVAFPYGICSYRGMTCECALYIMKMIHYYMSNRHKHFLPPEPESLFITCTKKFQLAAGDLIPTSHMKTWKLSFVPANKSVAELENATENWLGSGDWGDLRVFAHMKTENWEWPTEPCIAIQSHPNILFLHARSFAQLMVNIKIIEENRTGNMKNSPAIKHAINFTLFVSIGYVVPCIIFCFFSFCLNLVSYSFPHTYL